MDVVKEKKISAKNNSMQEEKPFIGLRWIIVMLMFFTYASTFFLRNSIGVVVAAMVNVTVNTEDEMNSKDACEAAIHKNSSDSQSTNGEFYWTASQQGIILGAYFWGFVISRLFMSRIAEKFGQRQSISLSLILAGLITFASPFLSELSPYALAAARFATGLVFGPFPGILTSLISSWAPRRELSIMSTTSFAGATLGATIGLVTSGWLTENYGWRIVFFVSGALTIIMAPFWLLIARNSPFDHPWLTNYERKLLMENINIRTKKSVPWIKLFTSPYVAICVYCLLARTWLDVIVNAEGPSYFRYKIGLDLNTASYVVGTSNLCSVFFMLTFGRISDFIINQKYLSKVNSRKFFHIIGVGGSVIILLLLVLIQCNSTAAITLWILLGGISVACSCSFNVSVIDIAPNYTASVHSILAIGSIGSAVAPTITAAFLNQGNGWNKTFYLAAGINVLSLLVYVPFMTAEPQPWNFEEKELDFNNIVYETKL